MTHRLTHRMTHQEPVVAIVYTTIPQDKAVDFATKAVQSRLAACVNVMQGQSVYYWDNQVCHDAECMMIMKTSPHKQKALQQWVRHNHPYQCPAIVTWHAESSMDYATYVWQTVGDERVDDECVGDEFCDRATHTSEIADQTLTNESLTHKKSTDKKPNDEQRMDKKGADDCSHRNDGHEGP